MNDRPKQTSGGTITPYEAADLLKVTPQTIYNWIREGEVPATKVGKRLWRIPRSEFEQRFNISTASVDDTQ